MNVLHIVTWYTAFNEDILREGVFHYEQLCCQKNKCNVALYYPFDTSIKNEYERNEEKEILVYRTRQLKKKFFKIFIYLKYFRKIKKDFNPDIIHAHVALGAGKLAILLGKWYGIPVVISEHNPKEIMGLNSVKNRLISKYVYTNSKLNICVSNNQKEYLNSVFPKINFVTICNGVQLPDSIPNATLLLRTEINCCIVAAFYDKEIKGFQFLLPAIKEILDQNYSITLHICGGGQYLEFYQNLAKELGIEKNCIFYGQCGKKDVYSIIKEMDFLISASLFESAGITVEEALLLGKPVLVTKSGGANSLVNTSNSIVVEKGSSDALVNGIKEIIAKINQFDKNTIHKYAKENFDMNIVNDKIIGCYKKILEEK